MTPHPASPLARPRLLARMQALLAPPAAAVWLAAGAGMGKTTLARQWLAAHDGPGLWLALDPSRGDAASVLHQLAALTGTGLTLWRDQLAAPATALRPAWREVWKGVAPGTRLVIDDLQAAGSDEMLATWLPTALDTCPAAVTWLLLSRRPPPAALARAQLDGRVQRLPAGELAFTVDELQAWRPGLATSAPGRGAWPVALSADVPAELRDELLAQFLAHEVLPELAPDERAVLAALAWWPGPIDADSARTLAGEAASQALDALADRGLLVDRVSAGWQVHELLAAQFRPAPGAPDDDAWARTLGVLDAAGRADEAISVALHRVVEAPQAAATRLVQAAPRWLAACRHRLLAQACLAVPAAVRPAALWGALASALAPFDPRAGRDAAVTALDLTDEPALRGAALSQIIASYFQAFDRTEPLSHWLDRLTTLPASAEPALAVAAFSALFLREPAHPALPPWQRRVEALPAEASDPNLRLRAAMLLAKQAWYGGRHAGLPLLAQQARGALQAPGLSPYSQLLWGLTRQYQAWAEADLAGGREASAQALAHGAAHGLHGLDRHLRLHDACFAALAGDTDTAAAQYALAAEDADAGRRMEAWHLFSVGAWLALEQGRLADAAAAAALAVEAGAAMGPAPQAMSWVIAGQVALARGEPAAAALAALREAGRHGLNPRATLFGHWLRAAAWRPGEDEDVAADALARALAGMAAAGHGLWFGLHRATAARLAAWALARRIAPDAATRLVRQHRLLPPDGADAHWPWPVRLRRGATLRIECDGEPLPLPPRQPRRPLDLLTLLVEHGGEAPAVTLADRLWPEAEGDRALAAFEVALRRLRGLLGRPEVLRLSGGLLSLDRQQVWVEPVEPVVPPSFSGRQGVSPP